MFDVFNIDLNLSLTKEELIQLYFVLYGSSLVKIKSAPKSNIGYSQLLNQIEKYLISQGEENINLINTVKSKVLQSISKQKDRN